MSSSPSSPTISSASDLSCRAEWRDNTLTLQNDLFRETWRVEDEGRLRLISFVRAGGRDWVSPDVPRAPGADDAPLSSPPSPDSGLQWTATFNTRVTHRTGAGPVLLVELRLEQNPEQWRLHRFQIHPNVSGALHQILGPETDAALDALPNRSPDGTHSALLGTSRVKNNGQMLLTLPSLAHPLFALARRHVTVRDVQFVDQTDHHSNLVFEREWLMHPGERCLPLRSNLICIEDNATRGDEGFLWLLLAPLRRVRERWSPMFDFLLAYQHERLVATACPLGYAVARIAYSGGRTGATRALHDLQRAFYEAAPLQPGRLLSNTWGDRAGAAHLSEDFVRREILAARDLGVEVVQIDDGWQKGSTVNTVATGGVWNGFWAADPDFWTPHPVRFPKGLAPLVQAAADAGVQLGLWYAPDSTNDLANWERDAKRIIELWRDYGVAHFKLDALKLHSRLAETRFHALCDRVLEQSNGAIFFDFDATAENRPTYWGRPGGGALFLENRFTDEIGYHPHQTLRAVWTLAHYVRPERIRAEFLNPSRNVDRYGDDPLQPAAYPPEYLFAVTFPTSPLAWFEVCRIPPAIAARWRPLIAVWKSHREAFHKGDVLPIGDAPTGYAWTGFLSVRSSGKTIPAGSIAYALLFRELTDDSSCELALPAGLPAEIHGPGRVLAGEGSASLLAPGRLSVTIPSAQRFLLVVWNGES